MSLVALSKAIQRCDEYVKKGKTREERALRKKWCQPSIDEAKQAVKELTKEEKRLEKEAIKQTQKLEKEKKKQEAHELWMRTFDTAYLQGYRGPTY